MQVLDIIKETIKTKLDTVSRIDGKMWILVWFYFLAFIEIVLYIKDYRPCLFLLYLISFGVATYFLVRNFWLRDIRHLHPDLEIYLNHTGKLTYDGQDWYIEALYSQYSKIEDSVEDTLQHRRDDLKISIILFCISLLIFVISISIKFPSHFHGF
jgi:hypothetical protein